MPLVTSIAMLQEAQRGRYAIGAFNIENMEMAQAVISAAEEASAPVILQTMPSTVAYGSLALYAAMVGALARNGHVPVALHLDHGSSYELAQFAVEAGYTSVMIDGSALPFAENILVTQRVVRDAAGRVPVEAELGKIGDTADALTADDNTNPLQAAEFVSQTGIQSLAVAIGTAHGFYVGKPTLDKQRLSEIRMVVDIPLVLHGASGLSDAEIKDCIARGICKVNFATELRKAFIDGVKEGLAASPTRPDPKKLGKPAKERVKALVLTRMAVCGCVGKA